MNAEIFVDLVRKGVMKRAVDNVVTNLFKSSGRRSTPELIALSKWYIGLPVDDREMVIRALAEVSHAAVFGLFALLDGASRVDDEQPPGELELWHKGQAGRTKLNGDLHDLLNSEPWHR
jgi:hypothetical protein